MDDDQELDPAEVAESEPDRESAARKRRILMLLLAYSALLGVITCFLPEGDQVLDFLLGLPLLILVMSWCFTDAAERGHEIGWVMRLSLVLAFFIALPIYLLQTRGLRGFRAIGLAFLVAASMFLCTFAAGVATVLAGELTGLRAIES